MATMAAQRARESAQAAIARAQGHVRTRPAEPDDYDTPITPDVARAMRLRTEGGVR